MVSEFSNAFVTTLVNDIPDEYLRVIRDKLSVFSSDYDIQKKITDLQTYVSPVPDELVKYLACIKIEGGSDKTIATYKLCLTNFFLAVGKQYKDITGDDILVYLATYRSKRKIKNSSLELYRRAICSFFNWLVNNDYIINNPCKKIKPIKFQREKEITLTDYEVECIRSACKNVRDLAIIDFLLSTGCRCSELVSINVQDVDMENLRVEVLGKGSKRRTVFISGKAEHSLRQWLEIRKTMDTNSDALFIGKRDPHDRLKNCGVEALINDIGKACGIGRIHPHLFRKTMATNALLRGMDITMVQKILGHESVETTMIYISSTQKDVESAHRKYVI